VPVTDNLPTQHEVIYRHLWKHIGKSMPKSASAAGKLSPFDLPNELQTALYALYSHYAKTFELWRAEAMRCRLCSS
jgi:type III restriction enzyme